MKNYLLIGFIIIMIALYAVAIPLAKKKNREQHQQRLNEFQKSLNVGDRVMMAAGIIGKIDKFDGETIFLEIADKTVIEIDKMAIVGKV